MPYASIDELPKAVRSKLSAHQQSVFRNVFNSMMAQDSMDESRAFAGAWAQAKKAPKVKKNLRVDIIKYDEEQKIAYGWAYICTENGEISYDHSGEWVKPSTMEKALVTYMENYRVGKKNHSGEQVSTTIFAFPLTKEISAALGIDTNREGLIVGKKFYDEKTWQEVKSGKYPAFSIGGRAAGGNPRLRG